MEEAKKLERENAELQKKIAEIYGESF